MSEASNTPKIPVWQNRLARIRVLGPDIPTFRRDVQYVWGYIERLEARLAEAKARG